MKIREGIIEKIVLQSDYVYAIVRSIPVRVSFSNFETQGSEGELFGANGTPESMLSVAEILIPTDINPSTFSGSFDIYIGRRIPVLVDGSSPLLALINACAYSNSPRAVKGSIIKELRSVSRERKVNTSKYDLESKEILENILNEKWENIQSKSGVITYNDVRNWGYLDDKDLGFTGSKINKDKDQIMISNYKKGENAERCFLPKILIGGKRWV